MMPYSQYSDYWIPRDEVIVPLRATRQWSSYIETDGIQDWRVNLRAGVGETLRPKAYQVEVLWMLLVSAEPSDQISKHRTQNADSETRWDTGAVTATKRFSAMSPEHCPKCKEVLGNGTSIFEIIEIERLRRGINKQRWQIQGHRECLAAMIEGYLEDPAQR